MKKIIERISDFAPVIELMNDARASYYSQKYDKSELTGSILSISEPIMNRNNSNEENLKQYSNSAVSLVDLIGQGKASDSDFEAWFQRARINIAEMFFT